LFKDLMKTILDVHAQTVAVIRANVQNMTLEILPIIPCKAAMPLMLERLKSDKSRTVRDACALYLTTAIDSWCTTAEEGYLTPEIMTQVGGALIRAMRDPSPAVRDQAKKGIEVMRSKYYSIWEALVLDSEGPASKDRRLTKLLLRTLDEPDTALDDFSVASKGSLSTSRRSQKSAPSRYASSAPPLSSGSPNKRTPPPPARRKTTSKNMFGSSKSDHGGIKSTPSSAFSSPPQRRPPGGVTGMNDSSRRPVGGVPSQVVVSSTKKERSTGSLSSSLPHTGGRRLYSAGSLSTTSGGGGGLGPPQRMVPNNNTRPQQRQPREEIEQVPLGTIDRPSIGDRMSSAEYSNGGGSGNFDPGFLSPASTLTHTVRGEQDGLQFTFSAAEDEPEDHADGKMYIPNDDESGPFIGSFNELKRQAKNRRSRRSSILQERFRNSSGASNSSLLASESGIQKSVTSITEATNQEEETEFSSPQQKEEYLSIARQLLDAHRAHVDKIMETLRVEMDSMRDFEKKVMDEQHLSEDEVLTYFESIGLCLDQRSSSAEILQDEMDRIAGTTGNGDGE